MSSRDRFRVEPNARVRLAGVDPDFKGKHENKKAAADEMERDLDRLRDLQYLLYAEHNRSLLICLQGLDAAGKDGTIRHVFGAFNPQGARVHAFDVPSKEEADHDFLWRAHVPVPKKGEIVIFNRSHYEDVLVVRIHKLVPRKVWQERYELINSFERNLAAAGTIILKFYLHISEEEQLSRFKDRLDDPARHWKISEADYVERSFFKEYLRAYEDVLSLTSTAYAPWYIIPANHKWFRNLAISKIVGETLESLGMKFPPTHVDLAEIRRRYHAAKCE
jgi:PPK2 family polyphosphate:nucleotide phosphotransferase